MNDYWKKVEAAAGFLLRKIGPMPRVGLMTGTGLGRSLSALETVFAVGYKDIPGFPVSTVTGHAGRLVAGSLGGKPVVAMEGRFHLYEGYSPVEVAFPVRVMQAMGVGTLILTNAAGGLNPGFSAGDIMIIRDHINLTGENPLVGKNDDRWGIRFPDMTGIYTPVLAEMALQESMKKGISVKQGVYLGLKGPSLETPAETRFIRMIGADAVGMSTIQEVIAAVHGGMNILGLSAISNINDPDRPVPVTVEEIVRAAENAAGEIATLITLIVERMDA
ncbi:MAG: purine-nucleoside phosphorylase [Desulfosalsimonadaceae bacterium]